MNMKTPKSYKISQPQPLNVVHPSPLIDAPPSSSTQTKKETPTPSTVHAGKRQIITPKGGSSSRTAKRSKLTDPNSAEEVSKEMFVGSDLDKYWYDTTPFPQLHVILQNQNWEVLMSDFSCNPIFPNLMCEFI